MRSALCRSCYGDGVRIAVLAQNQAVLGGAETYLRWLLPELARHGHELALGLENPSRGARSRIDEGVPISTQWSLKELGIAGSRAAVAAFAPHLVYSHGLVDWSLERQVARQWRTLLYAHDYYGMCATGHRSHSRPFRSICSRTLGPACLGINYVRGCGARHPRSLLENYTLNVERQRNLSDFAGVAAASRHVRDELVRHGVPADRIHVIPYPPSELSPEPEAPIEHSRSDQLLFMGRVTRLKGAVESVRVVALASAELGRKLSLLVAGDGPQASACRDLGEKLGVDVDVRGWVDGAERVELLRRADLLLVPSLWPEPFGIVGLEAGCVGLPSVDFAVGGIRDWLRPGEGGEWTEELSAPALARAVARSLSDPEHYRRLRVGAWQMAQCFSPERHLRALIALFDELVLTRGAVA